METSRTAGSTLWTGRMHHGAPNGVQSRIWSSQPRSFLPYAHDHCIRMSDSAYAGYELPNPGQQQPVLPAVRGAGHNSGNLSGGRGYHCQKDI
ncbi:GM11078 [Drosophila sechellia]|uniref:GM11078 n=1 Tax=Drosophila sechellia TaxID=7238 RepID=B4IMC8_DROSE|nr:GM11078 [Drosophila sechellia]